MIHTRPSWDETWLNIANIISNRSYDPRTKVGALIVSSDNTTLLSLGYNGNYKSGPNEPDSLEPGKSGFIHAELNAIIKCDFHTHLQKNMYITLSPCIMCAKAIVNANISEVIYETEYRDTSGIKLLQSANIKVRKFIR